MVPTGALLDIAASLHRCTAASLHRAWRSCAAGALLPATCGLRLATCDLLLVPAQPTLNVALATTATTTTNSLNQPTRPRPQQHTWCQHQRPTGFGSLRTNEQWPRPSYHVAASNPLRSTPVASTRLTTTSPPGRRRRILLLLLLLLRLCLFLRQSEAVLHLLSSIPAVSPELPTRLGAHRPSLNRSLCPLVAVVYPTRLQPPPLRCPLHHHPLRPNPMPMVGLPPV